MRTSSRLSAAVLVLVAGLALTACNDTASGPGSTTNAGGAAAPASSSSSSSSGSAGASGSAGSAGTTATKGGATGGTSGSTGTKASGSSRCTVQDLRMTVLGPDGHASEQEPAYASLHVKNTSGRTCTLTGYPGIRLADDQDKSAPIDAVRHQGMGAGTVTLKPGQLANAELLYSDVNSEASPSGRYVCAVQGSKVSVILPDTTQQVQVPVSGGVDHGVISVCGTLTVNPFSGVPGVNG